MTRMRSTGLALFLLGAVAAYPQAQPAKPQPPPPAPPAAPAKPAPPPATAPVPDVKVVTTDPIHVLVLPMKGSYMQHPEAFERLGGFLAGKGVTPAGRPFARYFSDPSVGEDNLVWEVGFPVAAKVAAEAPFEIKDIPGGLTAVRVHTGPMEELGSAWGSFVQGLVASGYRPSGPATQIFQGDMFASPQVEMRIAVEKAQ